MKNHILMKTNFIICFIILVGFLGITLINHNTYQTILEDDIENISKLTSSHIYAEIDNELTKPIFVAQTMANDSFLRQWLIHEPENTSNEAYQNVLENYLDTYRQKYQYDTVFLISSNTNIYYYHDGVNKIVSPENEHDDWYYGFLDSKESYKLNIDTDEVNEGELTVFVDCRIETPQGELLGVTGVGLKMSRLQEMLEQHETEYALETLLMNSDGIIQVDTDSSKIDTVNFFEEQQLFYLRDPILNNRETMQIYWYPEGQLENCLISRYIENLDWYLIVCKNTTVIRNSFEQLIQQDVMIVIVILVLLLSLSSITITRYNCLLTKALNRDCLTDLPNQKSFSDSYRLLSKRKGQVLFLFDIDRFKAANDSRGHLFGNEVLAAVALCAREAVGKHGLVARWGGDEFIGLLYLPLDKTKEIFEKLESNLEQQRQKLDWNISISIGITVIEENSNLEYLLEQADQALYTSKKKGGACSTVYSEENKK